MNIRRRLIHVPVHKRRCKSKLAREEKCGDKNLERKAERAAEAWPKSLFEKGDLELYPGGLSYVNNAGDIIVPIAKKRRYSEPPAPVQLPPKDMRPEELGGKSPISAEAKRSAIASCYYYDFDAPPKSEWAGKDGTILSICRALPFGGTNS